jgi:tryptophanyl-tRNA synthetase
MPHPSTRKVSLTGIKPTGEPHLGNYVGAIQPALALADGEYESWYFIADVHALTTVRDPKLLAHYIRSVAATWLAAGLDPERTVFYRQFDVPETFTLDVLLRNITAKGLMNRAHAYKAARDKNLESGNDPDAGVNMGLFNYPVLMAADILIMGSDVIPVGLDQRQHVEYAADIAGSFNHLYGDVLTIPSAITPPSPTDMPGLDGRKMSKSYQNTIPLFAAEAQMRKLVMKIVTDARWPDERSDADDPSSPPLYESAAPYLILERFAPPGLLSEIVPRLASHQMGWGDLKKTLAAELERQLGPLRAEYERLMAPDSELDAVLAAGAEKARVRARATLETVAGAMGVAATPVGAR